MREIKFRLIDKHNTIVGYERWHPDGKWVYSSDNAHWKPDYIPHKFKDQFSGFKDRNLREIYETDEVQVFVGTFPPGEVTGGVIFENGKFGIPGPDPAIGPKFIDLARDITRTVVVGIPYRVILRPQGGTS